MQHGSVPHAADRRLYMGKKLCKKRISDASYNKPDRVVGRNFYKVTGGVVWNEVKFFNCLHYPCTHRRADIGMIVQHPGNRADRHAAIFCYIFYGHVGTPFGNVSGNVSSLYTSNISFLIRLSIVFSKKLKIILSIVCILNTKCLPKIYILHKFHLFSTEQRPRNINKKEI